MTIPEKALQWAIQIANDQSHGYSQQSRWGSPDYDCSSFCISAYRTGAGIPIDINKVNYTGNMSGLLQYGFKDVSKSVNFSTGSGLQKGDVIFYHKSGNVGHAVMYAGSGKIVHARGQSYGSSKPGDQGTEISVTPYYKGSFDHVYRYTGTGTAVSTPAAAKQNVKRYDVRTTLPLVKCGSVSRAVKVWQEIVGVEADGEFGKNTLAATLAFQRSYKPANGEAPLDDDGEVGPLTWAAGLKTVI